MIMIQEPSETKWYKINEEALLELLCNNAELMALSYGGVDNWDWYGYSIRDYLRNAENANYATLKDMAMDQLKDFERVD